MINTLAISKILAQRIIDANITTNIGYQNITYKPPNNAELYIILTEVPGDESPSSRTTSKGIFAFNIDVYVEAGTGPVNLKNNVKLIGDLFSPTGTGSRFVVNTDTVGILKTSEAVGGPASDGWYYSTVIVELKVLT